MQIIPAIEIFNGTCVFLNNGSFDDRVTYAESPGALAQSFVDEGFSFVHVVDLQGAQRGQVSNLDAIETILRVQGIKAEVGGGVRTKDEIQRLLELGAKRAVLGSIAVTLPSLVRKWIHEIGASRISIAVDVRNGKIAHSGWLGEVEQSPTMFMMEMKNAGAGSFIYTDIQAENSFVSPNLELYKELRSFFPKIELIASGGVTSVQDVEALAEAGLSGVIVGRALLNKTLQLKDLRRFAR